jgi:hypothetical protein
MDVLALYSVTHDVGGAPMLDDQPAYIPANQNASPGKHRQQVYTFDDPRPRPPRAGLPP